MTKSPNALQPRRVGGPANGALAEMATTVDDRYPEPPEFAVDENRFE